MNDVYTKPRNVSTYVMSATQRRFGATASKQRSSRSDGRSAGSPGTVVRGFFWRPRTPLIPRSRISRSTVERHHHAFPVQLQPHFPGSVNLSSLLAFPHLHDLVLQDDISGFPCRRLILTLLREVIRRHGKLQDRTDRFDAEPGPVRVNELD